MTNLVFKNRESFLSLSLVILLGLVHLAYPFHGDQALFTVGAKEMAQGEVLYRDFWDLKQPGIYYFYLLAGSFFGFSEVGIHLFELLYMVAFAATLLITLNGYFRNSTILYLVPLLTIGFYYSASSKWHLTQLEALVDFPLFLSLYFSHRAIESDRRRSFFFFLSGLMGGVVLLFKLIFLLMLLPFWFSALFYLLRQKRESLLKTIVEMMGAVGLGLLMPILLAIIYFASQDSLFIIYRTFFIYPPQIISELPFDGLSRLFSGLKWFLLRFAPVLALALPGIYGSLKGRRDFIFINLVIWCLSGLLVVLVQRHAWWQYHYLLLYAPVGILAAKGLDIGWSIFKERKSIFSLATARVIVLSMIVLLCLPTLSTLSKKVILFASYGFATTNEQRSIYQSKLSSDYSQILAETSFLAEPDALAGDIFVIGDPLFYFLSGRKQAIPLNGWSPELFLPHQWEQLVDELQTAKPPYIFVDNSSLKLIHDRAANAGTFIEQRYELFHNDDLGNWYVLRKDIFGSNMDKRFSTQVSAMSYSKLPLHEVNISG